MKMRGTKQTHPVILQHVKVPLSKLFAALQVIHALRVIAVIELLADKPCLHRAHPRLADDLLALGEACCPSSVQERWFIKAKTEYLCILPHGLRLLAWRVNGDEKDVVVVG